jgi:hypothetical protein
MSLLSWGWYTPMRCAILEQRHRRQVMGDAFAKETPSCWQLDGTLSGSDSNTSRRVYDRYALSDNLDGSPLLQRGWVVQTVQEYITLKRRIPSLDAAENLYKEQIYYFWSDIVAHYSGCGITMEGDKLVAISGIAKRTKDVLEDEYHAGLWARKLPFNLSWSVRESGRVIPLPASYQAPSWSWASVKAAVISPYCYNYDDYTKPLALVKDNLTISKSYRRGIGGIYPAEGDAQNHCLQAKNVRNRQPNIRQYLYLWKLDEGIQREDQNVQS